MTIPLVQVGLDRGSAPLGELEEAHRARADRAPEAGVALVTCHRVELYLEGEALLEPGEAARRFERWLGKRTGAAPTVRVGEEAARHLLRVASGLESAIVGDDQILGQARTAYREACEAGRAGRLLHRLFHAAFRAGRRVRSETPMKEGSRSLAGAAVAETGRILGGLEGRTVTVAGAGEMARLAARLLAERRVGRLLVVNRTFARGRELALACAGEAVPWEWREAAFAASSAAFLAARVDVPYLSAPAAAALARHDGEPFVLADLGVPRNAEPPASHRPGLALLDVDSLARGRRERESLRGGAVPPAEGIVEEELVRWVAFALQGGMTENRAEAAVRAACQAGGRPYRPVRG